MQRKPRVDDFGPWSTSATSPTVQSAAHSGSANTSDADSGLLDFVFGAYRNYLTKIDGARCEHRPTCSHYAYLAFKKHGYVIGSMMTIDRLLRSRRSSTLRELEIYKVEDGARYHYDPVENNDFYF